MVVLVWRLCGGGGVVGLVGWWCWCSSGVSVVVLMLLFLLFLFLFLVVVCRCFLSVGFANFSFFLTYPISTLLQLNLPFLPNSPLDHQPITLPFNPPS